MNQNFIQPFERKTSFQITECLIQGCILMRMRLMASKEPKTLTPTQSELSEAANNNNGDRIARSNATLTEHLANIDKLLSAAYELMKDAPAIDKNAFEQLRQLRVKIRYARSAAAVVPEPGAPPLVAPELWENHPSAEDVLSFTKRVYFPWLGPNMSICRSDLKRLDKKLYNALYDLPNPGDKLTSIGLPTKKQLNDFKLKTIGKLKRPSPSWRLSDLPRDERERARLYNLARRRRQRTGKAGQ